MKKYLISLMAVVFTAVSAYAQENQGMNVYPVPAIFYGKDIKSKVFQNIVNNNRKKFINLYLDTFNKYFGNSVSEISDKNKYNTFAVYVNIPRVSEYEIKKLDTLLDIYMPMTMTINFTNMATGETLYSSADTIFSLYPSTTLHSEKQKQSAMTDIDIEAYNELLNKLIKISRENFNQFGVINAKIKDTYRKLLILDKGLEGGIALGDSLIDEDSNNINVIYSDLTYSVAETVMGNPSHSSTFNKFANSNSVNQLTRPKVLFINDFNDDRLYDIFSSGLGSEAKFSLINVNTSYNDVQKAVVSLNNNFKTQNVYNRNLPDYFLKLYLGRPIVEKVKTTDKNMELHRYAMSACGVIFDTKGRILYSDCVDKISQPQKIYFDRTFNEMEQAEITAKDTLISLAEKMKQNIKFQDVRFKIKKTDGDFITLVDNKGYLGYNNNLTVFKKIKTDKSGQEILVPAFEYRVVSRNGNLADCKMSIPLIEGLEYPSKRDIVQTTAMTGSGNKINMFNYNPINVEMEGNEIVLDNFEEFAFASIASSFKAPIAIHPADFKDQLDVINSLGFKKKLNIPENKGELTISPTYKIKKINEEKLGVVIKRDYEITVGVETRKNNELLNREVASKNISIIVPRKNNKEITQFELMRNVHPLIQQVAKNIKQ